VDLERAFYAQVANHFTEAEIIGCLFHFKQALCRKMIKLGIPDDEVKFCMRKGTIDLSTAIPKDDLTKGVNFIATMIFDYCADIGKGTDEYKESEEHWGLFWGDYFIPSVIKSKKIYFSLLH
jgi:hypothetical protein